MKTKVIIASAIFSIIVGCSSKEDKSAQFMSKAPPKKPLPEVAIDRVTEMESWFTKDAEQNNAEGTGADRAYEQLKLKNTKQIIVAVIDSGVDIYHEDLQGKIWTNSNEISNNGKDDDNNGYIDDVYGWNFIGGYDAEGKVVHINQEQLEVTRELVKMRAKKKALEDQGLSLSEKDKAYFEKLDKEVSEALSDSQENFDLLATILEDMKTNFDILQPILGEDVTFEKLTKSQVEMALPKNENQEVAQAKILNHFIATGASDVARLIMIQGLYGDDINYYYNESFLPRVIVGDDPEDFSDTHYGNHEVVGPDADHGTHVAGIIAANRNNNIGIKGIAENVKIMTLRVVPNGDERDKDVALAVRYAADNGANVINMSFGKGYSPGKKQVGEAFQYAASKGVLIIHASGNESTDRDQEDRFPMRYTYNDNDERVDEISTYLDIGASSQFKNRELTATFTNFGQKSVDFFAPGVRLNSTIPGNRYAVFSGTSMACPAAAGVTALVWSQYPEKSALEIKDILIQSTRSRAGLSVRLPSNHSKNVSFETLSKTGGIVDAFRALSL